jgi:spermidine/putrescine transport system ATP-binding protein
MATGGSGAVALRPEKVRLQASGAGIDDDNRFHATVSEFHYQGDVTDYIVTTRGGARIEALLANSAAGRTQFFEVGDAVELGWPAAAGHFISE